MSLGFEMGPNPRFAAYESSRRHHRAKAAATATAVSVVLLGTAYGIVAGLHSDRDTGTSSSSADDMNSCRPVGEQEVNVGPIQTVGQLVLEIEGGMTLPGGPCRSEGEAIVRQALGSNEVEPRHTTVTLPRTFEIIPQD